MSESQLAGPPPAVAAFPFRPGSDRGTVEDLYLYLDRPVRPPVSVAGPSSSASGGSDFQFEDAGSTPLFDTAGAVHTVRQWSSQFDLHRWRHGNDHLSVLVKAGVGPYAPPGSVLDERAWGAANPSVRVIVVNGVEISAGRVVIKGGYNMDVSADVAAGTVTLAAVSGGGEGVYADCGPGDPVLRTVSRTPPSTAGAFQLTGAECLSVSAAENAVVITGDCRPCLDCEDIIRLYKALKQADAAGAALAARLANSIAQYNDAVARWNAQRDCREAEPLKISVAPYRSGGTTCASIMVGYCNTTQSCQADASLTLTWSAPVTGQYVNGSGVLYPPTGSPVAYAPGGSWPAFDVGWGSIDPGRSSRFKGSFCFPGGSPGGTATLTATVSIGGAPNTATASATVTFR